jgi:hypothetical protein
MVELNAGPLLVPPVQPCTTTATVATFRVVLCEPPLVEALIVTAVGAMTDFVETLNVAVVEPAGTVTVEGTIAAALSEESETVVPPVGAAEASVTVPEVELVPITPLGLSETDETAGAATLVSGLLLLPPPPPPQLTSTAKAARAHNPNAIPSSLRLRATPVAAPPHRTIALIAVQASDHGACNGCSGFRLLTWLCALTVNVIGTPETATHGFGHVGVQLMPVTVVGSAPPATKQLTLIGEAEPLKVAVKVVEPLPRVTLILGGAPLIEKSAGAAGVVVALFANSNTSL